MAIETRSLTLREEHTLQICNSGVLRNKSGYRTDKEWEILNPTQHIYANHPVLLGPWGQGGNDVLKMYIQNAYTILVTTTKNHIKWSSKGGFRFITSNHTTPRHTVHDLDNVLYNPLTLPTSIWLTALTDKTLQTENTFLAQSYLLLRARNCKNVPEITG